MTNSEISNLEWKVVEASVQRRQAEAELGRCLRDNWPKGAHSSDEWGAIFDQIGATPLSRAAESARLGQESAVDALIAAREKAENDA